MAIPSKATPGSELNRQVGREWVGATFSDHSKEDPATRVRRGRHHDSTLPARARPGRKCANHGQDRGRNGQGVRKAGITPVGPVSHLPRQATLEDFAAAPDGHAPSGADGASNVADKTRVAGHRERRDDQVARRRRSARAGQETANVCGATGPTLPQRGSSAHGDSGGGISDASTDPWNRALVPAIHRTPTGHAGPPASCVRFRVAPVASAPHA